MFSGMKLYAIIACVGLCLALGTYAHHSVYTSGVHDGTASMQAKVDAANVDIGKLTVEKANLEDAVASANAKVDKAKAESDQKLSEVAQVVQKLGTENTKAQSELLRWRSKFQNVTLSGDCATIAKAQVCDALADY
jgi:CRISPR/Cas system-associated endonuclease Cas3-HD